MVVLTWGARHRWPMVGLLVPIPLLGLAFLWRPPAECRPSSHEEAYDTLSSLTKRLQPST